MPYVTSQYLDSFDAPFLARITAKLFVGGSGSSGSGSGTGQWQYAWTEQDINPSTGAAINCASPRQGTTTLNYAVEINNNEITVPTYRWLRFRSLVLGQPVYEFFSDGSGVSGTTLNYRDDCLGANDERWVQIVTYVNGVVSSISPWLFDSMQGCCSCVGYMPGGAGAQGDSSATAISNSAISGPCTVVPVPETLYLTINGFTAGCVCLNGFTATLHYDYGLARWKTTPTNLPDPCGNTIEIFLECLSFGGGLWVLTLYNPDAFHSSAGTTTGDFPLVFGINFSASGSNCTEFQSNVATVTT